MKLNKQNSLQSLIPSRDDDPYFYKMAFGVAYKIPSEETLRQRLDDIGALIRATVLAENVEMLCSNEIHPSKIKEGYVPVDSDVSPFDNSKTHKEGVSRTNKGYDGYAPMLSYIGAEGYLINLQLREESQHCQCGTPKYLRETVALCKQVTDEKLLYRLDSGNDAAENMGIFLENGCFFNVKHNLRRECKDSWIKLAKEHCQNVTTPCDGKAVYIGSDWRDIAYTGEDGTAKMQTIHIVYEIIERTTDKNGQFLLVPDAWVNTLFWNWPFWPSTSFA